MLSSEIRPCWKSLDLIFMNEYIREEKHLCVTFISFSNHFVAVLFYVLCLAAEMCLTYLVLNLFLDLAVKKT